MTFREQIERLFSNLLALGPRRLALLAAIGVAVFALVGAAGYYPQPSRQRNPLFRPRQAGCLAHRRGAQGGGRRLRRFSRRRDGLCRLWRHRAGAHAAGGTGSAALAAARAMNCSTSSASLGLTSFMQEHHPRAGAGGRTGAHHPDHEGREGGAGPSGHARRRLVSPRQAADPSASVVLRTEGADDALIAQAVRHLVAAAMPGMKIDQVTVLNVDGQLLASGEDGGDSGPSKMLTLEKSVSDEIQHQCPPHAGALSLAAQFPDQRRSAAEHRQEGNDRDDLRSGLARSSARCAPPRRRRPRRTPRPSRRPRRPQRAAAQPLPGRWQAGQRGKPEEGGADQFRTLLQDHCRRSRTASSIEHLSVAVLVNRPGLAATLGDKATPEQIDKQVGGDRATGRLGGRPAQGSRRRRQGFGGRFHRQRQGA